MVNFSLKFCSVSSSVNPLMDMKMDAEALFMVEMLGAGEALVPAGTFRPDFWSFTVSIGGSKVS